MSKSKSITLAQKKKRLFQLRDAQRRRRERLREDKQHFVQIILQESVVQKISAMIKLSGESMQQAIARLVQSALLGESSIGNEAPPIAVAVADLKKARDVAHVSPTPVPLNEFPELENATASRNSNQLDLFV